MEQHDGIRVNINRRERRGTIERRIWSPNIQLNFNYDVPPPVTITSEWTTTIPSTDFDIPITMRSVSDPRFAPPIVAFSDLGTLSMNDIFSERLNEMYLALSENETKRDEAITIDIKESEYKEETSIDCTVCCVEINKGEKIVKLDCNHVFHINCIDEWVKYKQECPNCRNKIKTKRN